MMIRTISPLCYICFRGFLFHVRTRGEIREKFKQCHAWSFQPVDLDQSSVDAFDRPNNLIGCLHSCSFHSSLYYVHEQLQLGAVVWCCLPLFCVCMCVRLLRRVCLCVCSSWMGNIFSDVPFQTATSLMSFSRFPKRSKRTPFSI